MYALPRERCETPRNSRCMTAIQRSIAFFVDRIPLPTS